MALQCGAKSAWRHLFTIKSAVIGAARPQAVRSVYELTPHPMDDRSYEAALRILSSLIAFKSRAEGKGWRDAFENMEVYADRVGLGGGKLDELSVIHVAGTKGKGSTCAMVESILRSCGYKTGLYTSPHLVDVRERIRIDG